MTERLSVALADPPAPLAGSEKRAKTRTNYAQIFNQKRQIVWFALFVLWLCIDIAELGLVSQQIHERTRDVSSWPNAETQNAMGLLLFACIISLLFGLFHWAASLFMYHVLFLVSGRLVHPTLGRFHEYSAYIPATSSSFRFGFAALDSSLTGTDARCVLGHWRRYHRGHPLRARSAVQGASLPLPGTMGKLCRQLLEVDRDRRSRLGDV